MPRPKTMPSEMEVFAMSKMLKKPIVVVGDTFHTIVKCGVEDFAEESPDCHVHSKSARRWPLRQRCGQ